MTTQPILKRRPREYTGDEIAIAFQHRIAVAAKILGKTPKAIERLRARVRERQLIEAGEGIE